MTELNGVATKTAASALLDRKLKLMEELNCRDQFAQLAELDEHILTLAQQHVDATRQLAAAQGECEEAATVAAIEIEGKNESERKAKKLLALRTNPDYQEATRSLGRTEATVAQIGADMDRAKRKARRIELEVNYRVGILRFLGD